MPFLGLFVAETNLKKQGMLPLTFANPADYDKIAPEDQITLRVTNLAPGVPVKCIVHKEGGQDVEITLNHTVCGQPSCSLARHGCFPPKQIAFSVRIDI